MALAVRITVLLLGVSACALGQGLTLPEVPRDFAQRGPSGSSVSMLLRMTAIHEALRLDSEQRHELQTRFTELSRLRQTFFRNLVDGKVFEDRLPPGELRSILDLYNEYHEKSLLTILSDDQLQQLGKIVVQLHDARHPRNEELADRLPRTSPPRDHLGMMRSDERALAQRTEEMLVQARTGRNDWNPQYRRISPRMVSVSQRGRSAKRLQSAGIRRKSSSSAVAWHFSVSPRYHLASDSP